MTNASILYLFMDQLRADSLGSPVQVPNLARLMDESLVFDRCISNSPLCVPARAALMTGLLPRTTGVWSNARAADPSCPSHVRNIRNAGYHTAVIGKTHLWRTGAGPKPGLHAREMDPILEEWGFNERIEVNDPIGTGSQGCAYTDHLDSIGCLKEHQAYIQSWIRELRSRDPQPWDQVPSPVPDGEDIDSFIGRSAVDWLNNYNRSEPFYLQVQFTGPHDPYDGPQRLRDEYSLDDIDVGKRENLEEAETQRFGSIRTATHKQIRQWRINYYANITLIDEWVGRLIETLRSIGALDQCWIVLCSDHGEMLGDHGRMGKAVFYDSAVRVPCFIRPPKGIRRIEIDDPIEQIDLTATLLEIANAEPISTSQGRSLLGHLNGSNLTPKRAVVSELFGITMVETGEWKLSLNLLNGEPNVLTNRIEDPYEQTNVAADGDYRDTIAQLIAEHIEPLVDRMNESEFTRYQEYVRTTGRLN